jgi:methionyl-tRNA formyltransferase
MKVTILTDNKNSWFIPYGLELSEEISKIEGFDCEFVTNKRDVRDNNDVLFMLSCVNIVEKEILNKSKNNIVIHASDLPKGKGFSPLQWQVEEGASSITLTLFEAVDEVDAGPYYLKDSFTLDGTELLPEIREKMAILIKAMAIKYLKNYNSLAPVEQKGEEYHYSRRSEVNDELDISLSIEDQINKFRVADNERFPLFFKYKNKKYFLRISDE